MKSKFIGEKKLSIGNAYSRSDVGYAHTLLALMKVSECERIGFFNLRDTYDNYLTDEGFVLNPRKDLNNEQFVDELNECTTYLFLRKKSPELYYYVGKSSKAVTRLDCTHLLLKLNTKLIPDKIFKALSKCFNDFSPVICNSANTTAFFAQRCAHCRQSRPQAAPPLTQSNFAPSVPCAGNGGRQRPSRSR